MLFLSSVHPGYQNIYSLLISDGLIIEIIQQKFSVKNIIIIINLHVNYTVYNYSMLRSDFRFFWYLTFSSVWDFKSRVYYTVWRHVLHHVTPRVTPRDTIRTLFYSTSCSNSSSRTLTCIGNQVVDTTRVLALKRLVQLLGAAAYSLYWWSFRACSSGYSWSNILPLYTEMC